MPLPILDSNMRVGWEPDTPSSDSILRAFLTNWSNLTETEIAAHGGQSLIRDDFAAFDVGRPAGFANIVFFLAPFFPEGTDEIVTALDDFFGFTSGDKTGEVYIFSPWLTPDLRPAGWNLMGHPPIMLRAAGGEMPSLPDGLRIEEVRTESSLHAFEQVVIRGFPIEELTSLSPGSVFSTAILDDERTKSLAWLGRRTTSQRGAHAGGRRDQPCASRRHRSRSSPAWIWRGADAGRRRLPIPRFLPCLSPAMKAAWSTRRWAISALFRFTGWRRARPGA